MCKEDNSQLCSNRGYKLSSVVPDIATSNNVVQINIGGDDDDIVDFKPYTAYRVKIILEVNTNYESDIVNIDLEDVLNFAKKYCYDLFQKVQKG